MIVLSDNDVILKLAQCNLLSQLPVVFNQPPEQIFINPAARFQLLPKNPDKAIRKCGSQVVYEQVAPSSNLCRISRKFKIPSLLSFWGVCPELM